MLLPGLEKYGFGQHIWDLDITTLIEARKVIQISASPFTLLLLHSLHFPSSPPSSHSPPLTNKQCNIHLGRLRNRNHIPLGLQPDKTLHLVFLHTSSSRLVDVQVYCHGPDEYGVYCGVFGGVYCGVVFDLSAFCEFYFSFSFVLLFAVKEGGDGGIRQGEEKEMWYNNR